MGLYRQWCLYKAEVKRKRLVPLLKKQETILDIGTGNGALAHLIAKEGHSITTLDVKPKCIFDNLENHLYDGGVFPFPDSAFSTSLLITMLHHTRDPEHILREAIRVSNRLIVMEDVYSNRFQQYLTYFADKVVNAEFIGHPHTNKSDSDWKACFESLGLDLCREESVRFGWFFRQVTYVLEVRAIHKKIKSEPSVKMKLPKAG